MQLKNKKIATSLAAATCSLLSAASGPSIAAEDTRKWEFDTAFFYYGESDRVTDGSARFYARKTFRNDSAWAFSLSVDSLTGSSASGATPANVAQTFTTPSGRSSYVVEPGQLPLDPSFLDTRFAFAADWSKPIGKKWGVNLGASFSTEYDYQHAGINGGVTRDFNNRNTSILLGFAFASDTIDPEGGIPIPFAAMLPEDDDEGPPANRAGSGDDKTVVDLLIGITQVLGQRTIAQFNYSMSRADGYLSDPFKLISVVDPISGDPVLGPGDLFLYRYEARPDQRTKQSFYGQIKHHLNRDIIDGSYRYMTDDWGITSHTVDMHYRWKMGARSYLQPHLRWYTQSAADFYRFSLTDGDELPLHATADYRLGEFDAYTAGVKYGRLLGGRKEWSIRAELYSQTGDGSPAAAIGSQKSFDLYPTVDALIVQVGFNF